MKKRLIYAAICALLGGCLVGPNYRPPEPVICDAWSGNITNALCISCDAPPVAWWCLFNDPLLNKYIEMGALYNKDVQIAEVTICQARALKQVAASYLFPHLSADLNASRTYFSKNGPVFSFAPGNIDTSSITGLPFQIQIPQIQTIYNALLDVSWEIDIFGKRRRGVEVASANIGSAIEQRNDVLISILAEIAINYMELRSNQKRVLLVEENIELLEKNVLIEKKRFETGYDNRLNLDRIEAEALQAKAILPDIYAQIYQNIYAISVLTGNLPETLLCELIPMQPLPQPPQQITVGIRSDLLRRRPDIRQAERELAAATANIGVAVASFFPTFTLLGDIGLQSLKLSNLFQANSLTWSLGGDVSIPIFRGGKLVGDLRVSEAQAAAAAFGYQQTVLTALAEAESALASYSEERRTSTLLTEAAERYEKLVSLTNERYIKGLVNMTDLLDVQRQWNAAEQNLLTSMTSALIDLVILYKSLGGGWQPIDDCLAY